MLANGPHHSENHPPSAGWGDRGHPLLCDLRALCVKSSHRTNRVYGITHNEISGDVIESALEIHKRLGPGPWERVDRKLLAHELRKRKFDGLEACPIAVEWDEVRLAAGAAKHDLPPRTPRTPRETCLDEKGPRFPWGLLWASTCRADSLPTQEE